jgi:uncharacterized protein (TIGR03086 family)
LTARSNHFAPEEDPVSDLLSLYRVIADGFDARLAAARESALANPSPCPGWKASDIPAHVVGVARSYLAVAETGDVPQGLEAYVADMAARGKAAVAEAGSAAEAFRVLRSQMEARLSDPALAAEPMTTPFGEMPFAAVAVFVHGGDMLTHTWDFAKAVGGDEKLDEGAAAAILEAWGPLDAALRTPGVCGPRIDVSTDSDAATRFIAFTGRQP